MRIPLEVEVVVIAAGAAGVAAGQRLAGAKMTFAVFEARSRIGGRAWTVNEGGFPLDVGCGWLHSAEHNPWSSIAEAEGFTVDRSEPPGVSQRSNTALAPTSSANFVRPWKYFMVGLTRRVKATATGLFRIFSSRAANGIRF